MTKPIPFPATALGREIEVAVAEHIDGYVWRAMTVGPKKPIRFLIKGTDRQNWGSDCPLSKDKSEDVAADYDRNVPRYLSNADHVLRLLHNSNWEIQRHETKDLHFVDYTVTLHAYVTEDRKKRRSAFTWIGRAETFTLAACLALLKAHDHDFTSRIPETLTSATP